jgi:hypothetical protein
MKGRTIQRVIIARDETNVTYYMVHACFCFATGGNLVVFLFSGELVTAGTAEGFQSPGE